jgi:hypothetical protein
MQEDLVDYNATFPMTCHFYVHFTGCALIRPTCAEPVMKLMEKQRRQRYTSHRTTVGRGDYVGDMGQDYTEEVVADGGGADTFEEWGSFLMQRQDSSTPLNSLSSSMFKGSAGGRWKGKGGGMPPSFQCGFYWYKNTSLSQHKVATPHVLAECGSVKERLVALCGNKDGELTRLCDSVLGRVDRGLEM